MGIVKTLPSNKTQSQLMVDGYTTPKAVADRASEDYECYVSSDNWTQCKKVSTAT